MLSHNYLSLLRCLVFVRKLRELISATRLVYFLVKGGYMIHLLSITLFIQCCVALLTAADRRKHSLVMWIVERDKHEQTLPLAHYLLYSYKGRVCASLTLWRFLRDVFNHECVTLSSLGSLCGNLWGATSWPICLVVNAAMQIKQSFCSWTSALNTKAPGCAFS